jgi:hypothetical protein
MSQPTEQEGNVRREGSWAKPVAGLEVTGAPATAMNLNVQGRRLTGPVRGFGQMWQKTYATRLNGAKVSPTELVSEWRENFSKFWPAGNHFYAPLTGIAPGEVAVLNLSGPGRMPLSTGIMVIYVDDESFSFMTPQGHMFAAMITFSARDEQGTTVAQVQALLRASDPFFELGCRLGFVHKREDEFWRGTLANLANHFGVQTPVEQKVVRVDSRLQWSEAGNVWHNAAIRSALYAPVHFARRLLRRPRA